MSHLFQQEPERAETDDPGVGRGVAKPKEMLQMRSKLTLDKQRVGSDEDDRRSPFVKNIARTALPTKFKTLAFALLVGWDH